MSKHSASVPKFLFLLLKVFFEKLILSRCKLLNKEKAPGDRFAYESRSNSLILRYSVKQVCDECLYFYHFLSFQSISQLVAGYYTSSAHGTYLQ
jgi:hypothetical protein